MRRKIYYNVYTCLREERVDNMLLNRNILTQRLRIVNSGARKIRNLKFWRALLILVVLSAILTLSPAISSLMNNVVINNFGQISTTTVWAKSGSAEDIQDAVNKVGAIGGGTVKVPEGTYNWYDDQVLVSYDNVAIMGQGIDVTIINQTKQAPFANMFYFSNCKNPRMTGFTLKGLIQVEGGPYRSIGVRFRNCKNFRVDHCKFIDFAEHAISIRSSSISDPCYGVVDHCTIMNPYKDKIPGSTWADGIDIRSDAYSPSAWDNNIVHFLGQYPANQTHPVVYVEDCVTYQTRHAVTSNQLGWFVIRRNTFYQNNSNSIIDIHGGYDSICGGRGLECYDNVIDHQGTGGWGVCTRGGDGVIFNNTIKNTDIGVMLTLDSADDPKPTSEMWIWNNTFQSVSQQYVFDSYFTENEDYFLRAPNQEQDGFTYTPYTYPHPLTLQPAQ